MKLAPAGRGLAFRLSRILSSWVGGIWIVTATMVAWYVHHEIAESFDDALAESGYRLLDLVVLEANEIENLSPPGTPLSGAILEQHLPTIQTVANSQDLKHNYNSLIYQILSGSGEMLLHSMSAPAKRMVTDLTLGFSSSDLWRTYTLRSAEKNVYVVVADTTQHRRDSQRETLLWLILPLLAMLPVLVMVVRKVTAVELQGVQQIASAIAMRGGRNLAPIAVQGLSAELHSISESTNHLLLRLDEALNTERALAANAAHELRTPLAAARLSLSTAQTYPMSGEAQEAIAHVASSLELLSKRAEKLLQLSRAESAAALSQEVVDLGVLTSAVAQEFWQSEDAPSRLKLCLPEDQAVMALGDFDTLAIALRNLIENSLKYAPVANIYVTASNPATITVRDAGEGVSANDLSKLRDRHFQLDSNQAGYGLGLSIVRLIVEKHGGQLELRSPPKGFPHGFEAVINLGGTQL
jgi:two-component system OmpR family sensor kinase